jgi:hypothetical protein
MTEILDFTTFIPEPRIARIGSGENVEEVDISLFPAEAALYLVWVLDEKRKAWREAHPDETRSPGPGDLDLSQDEVIEVTARACRATNPKITADWLKKNCGLTQLTKFCTLMMESAQEQMNVPAEGKNSKKGKGAAGKNR